LYKDFASQLQKSQFTLLHAEAEHFGARRRGALNIQQLNTASKGILKKEEEV
jgi:hypothetical protein